MIGIDTYGLDLLIRNNEINCETFSENITSLNDSLDAMCESITGDSLSYLVSRINEEKSNLTKIQDRIKKYSEILSEVKKSYQQEEELIISQFNHMNSNR